MGINRRVLENASILAGSQIVAQLANFGFVVAFARTYGADLLGEYSFALSLGALLAAISGMGGGHLVLRAASENIARWRSLVGIFMPVQIVLGTLAIALVAASTRLADVPDDPRWIISLVCSYQLIVSLTVLVTTGFSAQERMAHGGYAEALRSIGILALGSAMIWFGLSASLTAATMPIVAGIVFLTLLAMAGRDLGAPVWKMARVEIVAALTQALPFLGIALANIVFLRMGILLLRIIAGAQAAGVFSAAERLVAAVIILQTMFTNAIYPRLIKLRQTDTERYRQAVRQTQRVVILISLPAATLLTLFASDLILLLYGPGYPRTADVLRVVSWIMIFRGLSGITSAVALAENRQTAVVASKITGVMSLLAASAILIPSHSALGLAEALVCAELIALVTLAWRLGAFAQLPTIVEPTARTLVACAIAAAAGILLQSELFTIRAGVTVGVGAIALWLFGGVRRRDVLYLRELLATRSRADS